MTNENAKAVLQKLFDGVDPVTGEILADDHVCASTVVMRALYTAIRALDGKSNEEIIRVPLSGEATQEKPNAGRPWTTEETCMLVELCDSGASTETICKKLHRRPRGIRQQLEKIGLYSKPAHANSLARSGTPWTEEEELLLSILRHDGMRTRDIANTLQRSEYAVKLRMELLEERSVPRADAADPLIFTDPHMQEMKEMHDRGMTVSQIAERFNRSEKSVSARLFYMGLIKDAPVRLPARKKDH